MFARNECITVCFDFSNDLWLQLCRKNGLISIRYIIRYVRISLSEHNAKYSFVTFFFVLRSKKAMTDELQQKRRISVEFIMKAGRSCIYPEISTIYVRFEQEKSNCSQIELQFSIYYSQYNTQMHTLHTPIQCAASERTQHHANPRLLLLCSVCIYVAYPKGNRTQTLY